MPCLDTNIILDFFNRDKSAVEKIGTLHKANAQITTTSINLYELYKGVYRSSRKKEGIEKIERLIATVSVIDYDSKAAETAVRIVEGLRAEGQSISELDSMIAAIAINNDETLVTRDSHFKRIKELRIETW